MNAQARTHWLPLIFGAFLVWGGLNGFLHKAYLRSMIFCAIGAALIYSSRTKRSAVIVQQEGGSSIRGTSELQGLPSLPGYVFRLRLRVFHLDWPDEEILDPNTNEVIGFARNESSYTLPVIGRPSEITIYDKQRHAPLLTIRRGTGGNTCYTESIVSAGDGAPLGTFKYVATKECTVGIFDNHGKQVGKIGGWNAQNPKPKLKFLDIEPGPVYMNNRLIGTWHSGWMKDTKLTLNQEQPANTYERAMLLASRYATTVLLVKNTY